MLRKTSKNEILHNTATRCNTPQQTSWRTSKGTFITWNAHELTQKEPKHMSNETCTDIKRYLHRVQERHVLGNIDMEATPVFFVTFWLRCPIQEGGTSRCPFGVLREIVQKQGVRGGGGKRGVFRKKSARSCVRICVYFWSTCISYCFLFSVLLCVSLCRKHTLMPDTPLKTSLSYTHTLSLSRSLSLSFTRTHQWGKQTYSELAQG